jgi:hypothetical protein
METKVISTSHLMKGTKWNVEYIIWPGVRELVVSSTLKF